MLGPSEKGFTEWEKFTIQSISGNTITLKTPVKYFHYGAQRPTVSTTNGEEYTLDSKFGGDIDMRTAVGHLTRGIVIQT